MRTIGHTQAWRCAAAAILVAVASAAAATAETLIENFSDDPFLDHGDGRPVFEQRGPAEAFQYEPGTPPIYGGDPPGSLRARYDTTEPTARAFAPLPRPLGADEPFEVSAIFVIRSEAFFADPSGFAQISFGLMNRATTGDDRSGDLEDFRADTFDTLEFDYFPNVSPFFGGPFTGGAAFGGAAGDDAFLNFSFATVPLELPLDTPLEARLEHRPEPGRVEIGIWRVRADGSREALTAEPILLGTSALSPPFLFDAVGVFVYHDGFNIFTQSGRSLRADVDFHRLLVSFGSPIPVRVRISPDPLFFSRRARFTRTRLAVRSSEDAGALAALAGPAPPIALWHNAVKLAGALRAELGDEEGELVVFFDSGQVLAGLGGVRGEVELQVRGAVEGAGRVFILGTAAGGGDNPGRRRR
ncbi:MAG: hypothetical protein V3U98_02875 [Acidobacteriota bacterium]